MPTNQAVTPTSASPRAVADLEEGLVLASVEVTAAPERVFDLLASNEITRWWVRPGVFDTREWSGDLRVEGAWQASGMSARGPYSLEGEFQAIEPGRRLVHTWRARGDAAASTVSYRLDPIDGGTRITLRQWGLTSPATCMATCLGWETSFDALQQMLEPAAASKA